MSERALDALARECGIEAEYRDAMGVVHVVADGTQRALLRAMGIAAEDEEICRRVLEERRKAGWMRTLPPVQVVRESQRPLEIEVHRPAEENAPLVWALELENGDRRSGEAGAGELELREEVEIDGRKFRRYALGLQAMPGPGYHWLEVAAPRQPAQAGRMRLIVAPDACYVPDAIAGEARAWGFQVQLYALRSRRNWGMGDLTDLKTLVEFCARAGAGIVAVNPLHALYVHNPAHTSPYSPSSRLFGNPLYVDAEAIPEFAECKAAQAAVREPAFRETLQALRAAELVDYPGVARMKLAVLELLYRNFRERHLGPGSPRGEAFRAFRDRSGKALRLHCVFEALQEHLHQKDPSIADWTAWPETLRTPDSPAALAFAQANAGRVEFFEYLQWQFDAQLAAVQARAEELGLGIGLDLDLAVSVDGAGSESWANQACYARLAGIGAPPDPLNLLGQNWGLPPLNPENLRESAYAPFIATLRENMRRGGALRIDHVMSLERLFWIPADAKLGEGAYVRSPFSDLLGILALESARNRCLVIGEDLGTVPDNFRETLRREGVLSFRPMFFERRSDEEFESPADYPQNAVATVSTHDLPTLKGFWLGYDIELRTKLELFPDPARRDAEVAARARDRLRLLAALEREGLLPEAMRDARPETECCDLLAPAVHRFVARSRSKLFLAQLEDVLGQLEQVNLPGTTEQHPNWRRKLSVELEDLHSEERVRAFVDAMRRERGAAEAPRSVPAPVAVEKTRIPTATYRLQFNQDFTFSMAAELVAYLHALGVSHCYASPYLKARPGSAHGYDIVDHNALNPEIGTQAEFERFVDTLRVHGMGQMLDLVPNHMGVMGADNAWWLDVLENGEASAYADFFDIDWAPLNPELRGKVLLPILGDHYGSVLERGELKLEYDAERGEFSLWFHEHRFPIDPGEYPRILGQRPLQLEESLGAQHPLLGGLRGLVAALQRLPRRTETSPERKAQRRRDQELHKARLAQLCAKSPEMRRFVDDSLAAINGTPGAPSSFDALHELILAQAYRPSYWRVASDEINYRRFFDINDLAALRMEREEVFEATHRLVLELAESGKVDALRIDHPDGLYDPLRYFERLQSRIAAARARLGRDARSATHRPVYLVVEKIIAPHERLPEDWPVHGTTGYRFANVVNGVFVDTAAEGRMAEIYTDFIGEQIDFGELVYRAKQLIVRTSLASELNVLANRLSRIAAIDRLTCDFTVSGLREVLAEIVACFPVYRTYIAPGRVSAEDRRFVEWAVSAAQRRALSADAAIFQFVRSVLLAAGSEDRSPQYREAAAAFAMRFQQLTGPVMAKGFEDTALYVYNRLLSLNEVGGDPRRFGFSPSAFHAASQDRAKTWPHTMLATTTHDGKRSEDVRARINVLSEMPEVWRVTLRRWSRINRSRKKEVDGALMPTANDEYALYQTLIGSWPVEDLDRQGLEAYRLRIEAYMTKLLREAKVRSSWMNPNEEYEKATLEFVRALLAPHKRNVFLKAFLPFQRRISRLGMFNSLSQTLIKLVSPGVPDLYQGTELWDYSLVDPDNRRPVNYLRRQAIADEFRRYASDPAGHRQASPPELLRTMEDGRIKMFVIHKALGLRRDRPALFRDGEYVPLYAEGSKADRLCAFARRRGDEVAIAVAPRLCAGLLEGTAEAPVGPGVWSDTRIVLPSGPPDLEYLNVFTGESLRPEPFKDGTCLPVAALLAQFPVALVHAGSPGTGAQSRASS
jgi:4-alpha-glucanotransferase/(1->4)-alpha-D-glucan 1-alpha-D-glucosylmutase